MKTKRSKGAYVLSDFVKIGVKLSHLFGAMGQDGEFYYQTLLKAYNIDHPYVSLCIAVFYYFYCFLLVFAYQQKNLELHMVNDVLIVNSKSMNAK